MLYASYEGSLLLVPPSSNALYLNRTKGRAKTESYKSWIASSGYAVNQDKHRDGPFALLHRQIELEYVIRLPPGSDLGNREKAMTDLLVNQGVIQDDRYVVKITLTKMMNYKDGGPQLLWKAIGLT